MIESIDRLSDDFYVEQELRQMAEDVINGDRFSTSKKHICWYQLYKDGVYTGKAMLLAVESIIDGRDSINTVCSEVGLTAQIGEYGEDTVLNGMFIEHVYIVLHKYRYKSKVNFVGSDKVFTYEPWMQKLVSGTA